MFIVSLNEKIIQQNEEIEKLCKDHYEEFLQSVNKIIKFQG
jgi:hypothetical protein